MVRLVSVIGLLICLVSGIPEHVYAQGALCVPKHTECLNSARTPTSINGSTTVPPSTKADATGINLTTSTGPGVNLNMGDNSCIAGGRIEGLFPESASWSVMHDHTAFRIGNGNNLLIEGLRIHNYGDSIAFKTNVQNFRIKGVYISHSRDDCIEMDFGNFGLIEDSLLEGCYSGFSTRPSVAGRGTFPSARDKVLEIRNTLVWMEPMLNVFNSPGPGYGNLFKWDNAGDDSPKLSIHNSIFRLDGVEGTNGLNIGSAAIPAGKLADCSNNTIVWLGSGPFPYSYPGCFTITTDKAIWDAAVASWKFRYGCGDGRIPPVANPIDPLVPTFTPFPTFPPVPIYTPVPTTVVCDLCGHCLGNPVPPDYTECVACMYGPAGDGSDPSVQLQTSPRQGYQWTIAGCLTTSIGGFTNQAVPLLITFITAINFLLMLYGGYLILTSAGNKYSVRRARQLFTVAAVSELILLGAVFLYTQVSRGILGLPGF